LSLRIHLAKSSFRADLCRAAPGFQSVTADGIAGGEGVHQAPIDGVVNLILSPKDGIWVRPASRGSRR
jgi:hypothetical protein